ncbi:MAG: hypothetical protein IPG32_14280 [Saprospirales bacterium]|nr:hypothetical protein [Saprospirales bacterium]
MGHPSNGSVENVFEDLKYGIIDIAGFGNIYSGCQMANLDAAWPEGVGVRIIDNVGKITVRNCDMEEVRCGVFGNNHRALDLFSNDIEALNYGINLYEGKRNVRIEDNVIAADDCIFIAASNNGNFPIDIKSNSLTPRSHGIYTGHINGKLNIEEANTIYMDHEPGAAHGIFGLLNSVPVVIKNTDLSFTDPDAAANTGITIMDCKNGQVVENTISGSSSNPYNLGLGIVGFNSPNYLYCCNELDDSQVGESFILMCNDNKIANTVFDDHYTALYLSHAVISPQINTGNDWTGATTTEDARYEGDFVLIPASLFEIDDDLVPSGHSKIFVPSGALPEDWFIFEGTDPICEDWTDEDEYCGKDPYFLVEDPNEFTALTSTDLAAIDPPQGSDTSAVLN